LLLLLLAAKGCDAAFGLYYGHEDDIREVASKEEQSGGLRKLSKNRIAKNNNHKKSQNRQRQRNLQTGDLDVRFQKFDFTNGAPIPGFMPLGQGAYPMQGDMAITLKNTSNAVSVVCVGDPAMNSTLPPNVDYYLNAIGGYPSMPNINQEDAFWVEMHEVTMLQLGRRFDMNPLTILRPPDLWLDKDIHTVAESVRADYPGSLQVELIEWLWSQGVSLDYNIMPFRSQSDFIGTQVTMAALNTWAIGAVAPFNFYLKWYAGRPRPEEVAFLIYNRELTAQEDGVPTDIVQMIDSMGLNTPEAFTAYPEGSPRHPSWPAMHSAASSASFWLAVVLDLTPEQYCEALRVDYAVAFARSCAGVHYRTDNTAGLNLGQELIAEFLPGHLEATYGSDRAKVEAKIASLRFDWNNFNSYDCTY
jgi:membrane-associated phospholipid phosphatase